MQKYNVIKILIFSLAVFITFYLLNLKYINTEIYKNRSGYNQIEKFLSMPFHIQIINLGSSHGQNSFDYTDLPIIGFNAGLGSQQYYYDYQILLNYMSHLDENAVVVIPISYNSFGRGVILKDSDNARYYQFLPLNSIYRFKLEDLIRYKYLPILTSNESKTAIFSDVEQTILDQSKNKYQTLEELEKGGIKRSQDHKKTIIMGNYADNKKYLKQIIELCLKNHKTPILITTPFTSFYNKHFDTNFLNSYFYKIINDVSSEYKINYFDYSHDSRFENNPELFLDTDHLNANGRLVFTKLVYQDLKNAEIIKN